MKILIIITAFLTVLLLGGAAFRLATMTPDTKPLLYIGLTPMEDDDDFVGVERVITTEKSPKMNAPPQDNDEIGRRRVSEMEQTTDFVGGGSSAPTAGGTEYNATSAVDRAKAGVEKEE